MDPNILSLSGDPGTIVSGSFIVHVSNASKGLSIRTLSATTLRANSGHEIPDSSVSFAASNMSIGPGSVIRLSLSIAIPNNAFPGNYSAQVLLLAQNGSPSYASLRLTVTPPLESYYSLYGIIALGVGLSFVYSPLGDKESKKDGGEQNKSKSDHSGDKQELHDAKIGQHPPENRNTKQWPYRLSWQRLKKSKVRDTLAVILLAAITSGVAFSYFLYSGTSFGAIPVRDYPSAFLQGFVAHRGIDTLKDKFFPGK